MSPLPPWAVRRRRCRSRAPSGRCSHADLRVFDPIWTTANITSYHGGMIYDTLFALNAQSRPQPQMIERWSVSDDRLAWTFQLRDGLAFP